MIYLIRHGKDDERYVGGYSDVPLLEKGKQQIIKSATWLKGNGYYFDTIYCSDIVRAVESAEILQTIIHGRIIYDSSFRELNKGKLNGMLKEDAITWYPEYFQDVSVDTVYPDGESMRKFYDRIQHLYSHMSDYEDSLIITHRGVINMFYYLLGHKELDMDKKQFGVTHGSIHELDLQNATIRRIFPC